VVAGVRAALQALSAPTPPDVGVEDMVRPSTHAVVEQVRRALAPYWPGLA